MAVVAAAALVAAFLIFGGEEQVLSLVNDDAYYYFQIVRNTLHGRGISFDGRDPTNGFHPLYFVLLLPIFALGDGNDILPIRLALLLLSLAYFATTIPLYGIVRRLAGQRAAGIAVLAWAFNPLFIFLARGGVEVAIYTFVASLMAFYYVDRFRPAATVRGALVMGVLAGLTLLARTDGLLFVAAIAADFILVRPPARPSGRRLATLALASAAPAALLIAPWALWNIRVFGTVVQVSAIAHTFADQRSRSLIPALSALERGARGPAAAVAVLAGIVGVVLLARFLWRERHRVGARIARAAFLPIYLALFLGTTVLWYGHYRNWYFLMPSLAFLTLIVVTLLSAEPGKRWAGGLIFAGVWVILAAAGLIKFGQQLASGEGSRATLLEDGRWIAAHLPEDTVIGCFNAGRCGYFLPRPVVNLDGVVNNQIIAAFATRSLDRYLAGRGIGYVLDRSGYVRFYFDRYAASGTSGLTPVRRMNAGELYRFEWLPARRRGAPRESLSCFMPGSGRRRRSPGSR